MKDLTDELHQVFVNGANKPLHTGNRIQCEKWIRANGISNVVYEIKLVNQKKKKDEGVVDRCLF